MATNNCPECRIAAGYMRDVADVLARGAGAEIGLAIGGPRGALIGGQLGPEVIERGALALASKVKRRRKTRKQSKRAKVMSKAMKNTQARARKANGSLKKGWSMSRVMKEAHKECHKEMKKK